MGRTARARRENPPPIQKLTLDARHAKPRLALAALLLVFGAACLVYALSGRASVEAGWTRIEASSGEASCAGDFTFLYPLGTTAAPAAELRALSGVYTSACAQAYRLFTNDARFDGVCNPRYLNEHPNEELPLDPALYAAFERIAQSGDRSLYLAPIHEICDGVFHLDDPALTAEFDPRQSEALRAWCAGVCAYANDPAQVEIELLGDNRARLRVSEEYLAFARAEEIESFIDFSWMRNAFIADYLARRLTEAGYASGTLSSVDGFMRNLDSAGAAEYALPLYDFIGGSARPAATLRYRGARAIVSLRDFPLGESDAARFAPLPDGSFATPYLDVADGLCRCAVDALAAYSESFGCAEIALRLAPVYIAETLDSGALDALARDGIHSVYCRDFTLYHTQPDADLAELGAGYACAP